MLVVVRLVVLLSVRRRRSIRLRGRGELLWVLDRVLLVVRLSGRRSAEGLWLLLLLLLSAL